MSNLIPIIKNSGNEANEGTKCFFDFELILINYYFMKDIEDIMLSYDFS